MRADELASRLGKSRSQVYHEALADYVLRRDPGAVTRALDEIADGSRPRTARSWPRRLAARLSATTVTAVGIRRGADRVVAGLAGT